MTEVSNSQWEVVFAITQNGKCKKVADNCEWGPIKLFNTIMKNVLDVPTKMYVWAKLNHDRKYYILFLYMGQI